MKKYLLFAGDHYYPGGGWRDFKGSFDTIEDAEKQTKREGFYDSGETVEYDWWHIIDSETGQEKCRD